MNLLRWPLIHEALLKGCLSFVDVAFAERLLRHTADVSQETVAFVCHMTLASREGHICVQIDENRVRPSPQSLWLKKEEVLSDELIGLLERLAIGAASLPPFLVTSAESCSFPNTPFCLLQRAISYYYLQKNWIYETFFLNRLERLLKASPEWTINPEEMAKSLDDLQKNGILNTCQSEAIFQGSQTAFIAIFGGPGTGKSYTAAQLINLLMNFIPAEMQKDYRIALAAPTGKAVVHLHNQIARAEGVEIVAKTVHSLLEIHSESILDESSITTIPYDLIIVDECSMMDVKLMGQLLASVKQGARLILLGDPFQLPSIEAGSLFADMIEVLDPKYKKELKTCFRIKNLDLHGFAGAVKEGIKPSKNFCVNDGEPFLDAAEKRFLAFQEGKNPEDLLLSFQQFRLLSPLRKGSCGVESINEKIHSRLSRRFLKAPFFAIPIMITKNDYKRELFNGEVGVLVQQRHQDGGDYALFFGKDGPRRIASVLLSSYEYAYCISVHKSQGSEFDSVFLMLPEGAERFGREVLYTAATRARHELVIWGKDEVFEEVLKRSAKRFSGIQVRLESLCNIKNSFL